MGTLVAVSPDDEFYFIFFSPFFFFLLFLLLLIFLVFLLFFLLLRSMLLLPLISSCEIELPNRMGTHPSPMSWPHSFDLKSSRLTLRRLNWHRFQALLSKHLFIIYSYSNAYAKYRIQLCRIDCSRNIVINQYNQFIVTFQIITGGSRASQQFSKLNNIHTIL